VTLHYKASGMVQPNGSCSDKEHLPHGRATIYIPDASEPCRYSAAVQPCSLTKKTKRGTLVSMQRPYRCSNRAVSAVLKLLRFLMFRGPHFTSIWLPKMIVAGLFWMFTIKFTL